MMAYADPVTEPMLMFVLLVSVAACVQALRCVLCEYRIHGADSEWQDVYSAVAITTSASAVVALVGVLLPYDYTPISRIAAGVWFVLMFGAYLLATMRLASFRHRDAKAQGHRAVAVP